MSGSVLVICDFRMVDLTDFTRFQEIHYSLGNAGSLSSAGGKILVRSLGMLGH